MLELGSSLLVSISPEIVGFQCNTKPVGLLSPKTELSPFSPSAQTPQECFQVPNVIYGRVFVYAPAITLVLVGRVWGFASE